MKNRISLKNIIQFIKRCFADAHIAFISIPAGISTGVLIYLGLLQRHFFSWRYLAYSLAIIFFSTIFYAWLNKNYIIPIYKSFSNNFRVFTLVFFIFLAGVLLLNTEIQPLYFILPDKTLEIEFTIGELASSEEGVRLLGIETGQGYIHYTRMDYEGEWERVFGNTIFPPGQTVRLFWQGKVGPLSNITFRSTNFNQEVRISWDGQESAHQLNNPESPNVTIKQSFKIPLVYTLPFIISFIISITYGVFVFLLALSNWNPGGKKKTVRRSKMYWMLFMLPMLAVWGFTLLVFWPGIISNDSIFQWQQGVTGQFDDWQSAFHAFILAGLMRIWYSPAVVTLIQIFVFALVVAWGLKTLADYGVPDVFLWLISFLFAIFPPNWILSITIWKDIPYAIAFLWLTILLVKIVLSKGKWLQKPLSWITLSLSVFLVGILRKNGIASAFISLIGLIFFYRKYWKKLLIAVLAVAILFFLISGPLYDFLEVSRTDNGQSNLIYLHHIAAHVNAGTDLTNEESEYLNRLMPTSNWFYWCCYVGTISYDNDFARSEYLSNTALNRQIAIDLFLSNTVLNRQIAIDLFFRAPWVDIAHSGMDFIIGYLVRRVGWWVMRLAWMTARSSRILLATMCSCSGDLVSWMMNFSSTCAPRFGSISPYSAWLL